MAASVYWSILNAVASIISNLGLTFGVTVVPIVVKKLGAVEQGLDTMPVIEVCPDRNPERVSPASAESQVFVEYRLEVYAYASGNSDFTSQNLDVYLNWREQIRRQFQGTLLAGVPQVYDTDMQPEDPVDRDLMYQNYDLTLLAITFKTIEPRGL